MKAQSLKVLNQSASVPQVDVADLDTQQVILLDTREPRETAISMIPGAIAVGYDHLDLSYLDSIPKDRDIVVYCSVGYRSSRVTEKLIHMGYTNARNLYGGIFKYVNTHQPVDSTGTPINRVHGYSQLWSWYVESDSIEVVFD